MKRIFSPVILIVTLVLLSAGGKLFSQFVPYIQVNQIVDACDSVSKTRLILSVNIGAIAKKDSLYGYDIEIKYDPTKIKILNYLAGNTLSEFFEERSFNFALDSNTIKGYATTFNFNYPPAYGDSVLIAFSAEWIGGNCADSSIVSLTGLNFTEEFKKKISDSLGYGVVYAMPFKNPNRIASITNNKKAVYLTDNQNEFNYNLKLSLPNYNYFKQLELAFDAKDTILIDGITPISNNLKIDKIADNDFLITNNSENSINELDLLVQAQYLLKDTIKNYPLMLNLVKFNDCSCILDFTQEQLLINKDSNFVNVVLEKNTEQIYNNSDEIIINNSENQINKIVVFNVLGEQICNRTIHNESEIKISTQELNKDVYFILIYEGNKIEKYKFYKC
jgi:hypothetical protein